MMGFGYSNTKLRIHYGTPVNMKYLAETCVYKAPDGHHSRVVYI